MQGLGFMWKKIEQEITRMISQPDKREMETLKTVTENQNRLT